MGIGGIGSSSSFFQDDQNYWQSAKAASAQQSASNALINVLGQAQVTKAKGLASIANKTALDRTNSQITALIQNILNGGTGTATTSTSSSGSSSASTKTGPTTVQPASGTGTIPVTTTTTLASLGIISGGTLTFGDGGNTPTTYTSTGSDTIGDVINAINSGPAFLTASISNGHLTVTARDTKKSVVISGSGTDAQVIGFGNKNDTFQPVQPTKSATSSSTTSSTTATTAAATTASTTKKSVAVPSALEISAGAAASILSANGVSGSLVNMLA